MGKDTGIEWCDHTFSPWHGCTKVSTGCDNCYAETLSRRWGREIWGPNAGRKFLSDGYWQQPLKWNKAAEQAGVRRRVFCGSMCDWAEGRPDQAEARDRLFELIEATPFLDWQLLTKRPGAIRHLVPPHWIAYPPTNVWYGTSVEDQEQADRRIPQLLQVPAAVRFLSCEPLLSAVDLTPWLRARRETRFPVSAFGEAQVADWPGLSWCIGGGESGPGARPMHPDWARSLRDQAVAAGVAYFFKQWGEYVPYIEMVNSGVTDAQSRRVTVWADSMQRQSPVTMLRLGKKAAGRLLDGKTWSEFPVSLPRAAEAGNV